MIDYIQKYQNLSPELKSEISTLAAMTTISRLEADYSVSLAATIMKVMAKTVLFSELPAYFASEYGLDKTTADKLTTDLKEKLFSGLGRYLGFESAKTAVRVGAPTPAGGGASFYFSAEDEEDVGKIASQTGATTQAEDDIAIKEKIDRIIAENKLIFSASVMADRFRQAMATYLKNVRNNIQTRDSLAKPFDSGGLGLDQGIIDKILQSADRIKILPEPVKKSAPESIKIAPTGLEALRNIGARDIEYDLAAEIKKKEESRAKAAGQNQFEKLDTGHELAPLHPMAVSGGKPAIASQAVEKPKPQIVVPEPSAPKKIEVKANLNVAPATRTEAAQTSVRPPSSAVPSGLFRPSSDSNGKVKMEDVKYVPHILDPVDELRYMNSINFRRLDSDPHVAVGKIKEKLALLEKEKFTKKIEGIKAWRSNPLNRLYIQIGQECIVKSTGIEQVSRRRQAAGEEYLTALECEAIMDLNRELRF